MYYVVVIAVICQLNFSAVLCFKKNMTLIQRKQNFTHYTLEKYFICSFLCKFQKLAIFFHIFRQFSAITICIA